MRIDRFLLVVILSSISLSSLAKDTDGVFAIKGVGVQQCKSFIVAASKDEPVLQQYAGYVSGYISAYNELESETFDLLAWQRLDTVMLLLLQGCKQTPESTVGGVISRVVKYFSSNAIKKNTEKVEVKGPSSSLYFYPEVISQIQEALKQQGYNIDDLWQAMEKYQQDKKLIGKSPFDQLILMKLLYGKK
ncbi:hypothetical protein [Thalassotalea atypica]|uniref:hypothetical protein n=1 Tax=Thalassotalea atypica TaxID=2054316 RepID=UPI00257416D9|nr:hypothetical protein [Thalassotalea atypica]